MVFSDSWLYILGIQILIQEVLMYSQIVWCIYLFFSYLLLVSGCGWVYTSLCTFLFKPAWHSATRHCMMGSKPQGGDPTALWGSSPQIIQNLSRSQHPAEWPQHPNKTPSELYKYTLYQTVWFLSAFALQEAQHTQVCQERLIYTFSPPSLNLAQVSPCTSTFEWFFFLVHCVNTDKQAPGKHTGARRSCKLLWSSEKINRPAW